MESTKNIIKPSELMPEVPLEIQEMVQPHLVAIYDERPDQVRTAFLTFWHGKPLLVTAKHTLFGHGFDEDPLAKQVHLKGNLRPLREISESRIANDHDLDVAIMQVRGFEPTRCLPYTTLQFDASPPDMTTIVGFLAHDFHRSKVGDPAVLGPRSTALNEERKQVRAELAQAPPAPEVVALHPDVLESYERQLENLQQSLAGCLASGETEAAQAMRDLVESVTVFRGESKPRGVIVEITGRLNSLLGEKAYPNHLKGVWGSVVAEEGLEPPTQGL